MEHHIKLEYEYELEIKRESEADDDQGLQIKVYESDDEKYTVPGDVEIKVEHCGSDEENSWLHQQAKKKKKNNTKSSKLMMFECTECKKQFTHSGNLKRHQTQFHSKNKAYPCDSCSKIFYRIDYLTRHQRNHKSKTKVCNCGIRIKIENKNHKNQCTWGSKSNMAATVKYQCDVCLKKYKDRQSLKRHKKLHLIFHNFFCDYCHLGFNLKKQLEKHIRKHMGMLDYAFECEICGKKYTGQGILNNHILVSHTGIMPFSCSKCDKKFKSKWGWKVHDLAGKCTIDSKSAS